MNLVTVSRLERGHSMPSVMTLLTICEVLGLPASRLFDIPLSSVSRNSLRKELLKRLRSAKDEDLYVAEEVLIRLLRK